MSWEATSYVKGLAECPDGAPLGRGQKLLLFVLADYHNTSHRMAWPSVMTLAAESLTSLPQTKRDLAYLEEHQVIARIKPSKFGAGLKYGYAFLEIDGEKKKRKGVQDEPLSRRRAVEKGVHGEPVSVSSARKGVHGEPVSDGDATEKRVQDEPLSDAKGVHGEPFFSPEKRGSEGVHGEQKRGSKRGSEGVHGAQRNKEEQRTNKPKATTEQHAASGALKAWFAIKSEMQQDLSADEYKLAVRPAYLLAVMGGTQLLVALPPNGRIVEAARRHHARLSELAQKHGYRGVSFTRYPDEYDRAQVKLQFPEFYEQMFGNKTEAQSA